MKLTVSVEIGNDAMMTGDELAAAVKRASKSIKNIYEGGEPIGEATFIRNNIRDDNGNRVGWWGIE
jgi:hypothetical protein